MAEKDTSSILVRLPTLLKKQLDSVAKDMDLSTAQVVRKLIKEFVDKNYKGDLFL